MRSFFLAKANSWKIGNLRLKPEAIDGSDLAETRPAGRVSQRGRNPTGREGVQRGVGRYP
jgi:hypothetical protein